MKVLSFGTILHVARADEEQPELLVTLFILHGSALKIYGFGLSASGLGFWD